MKKIFAAALAAACSAAFAAPAMYTVDPTHAGAIFEIDHFGTSTNRGRFPVKAGTVQFDRAAKSGKVDVTLDMTGIVTGVPVFDGHLKGDNFFKAEQFPTATFTGDKFVFSGDKVAEVQGTLTLLGKTNPVVLKATKFNCYESPMLKREVCGGDFEAVVKRSLFGMTYALDWGFADDVKVTIQVEAIHQ